MIDNYTDFIFTMIVEEFGLLGGARVLLAIGAQQRAKAWQSEIAHLQNGLPIHVLDVRDLAQQLAASSLDRHYEVEHVRAVVPHLLAGQAHDAVPVLGFEEFLERAAARGVHPLAHDQERVVLAIFRDRVQRGDAGIGRGGGGEADVPRGRGPPASKALT